METLPSQGDSIVEGIAFQGSLGLGPKAVIELREARAADALGIRHGLMQFGVFRLRRR